MASEAKRQDLVRQPWGAEEAMWVLAYGVHLVTAAAVFTLLSSESGHLFLKKFFLLNSLAVPIYSMILAVWALLYLPRRWFRFGGLLLLNLFVVVATLVWLWFIKYPPGAGG